MTSTPSQLNPTAVLKKTSHRRWWPTVALAVWSLAQLLLGGAWALGVDGYPFQAASDLEAQISLLAGLAPQPVSIALAGLGLVGLAAAAATTGSVPRSSASRAGLLTVLGAGAAGLVMVVPDFRLLAAVAYTPLLVVGSLFGWPEGGSVAEAWPWPITYQGFGLIGGLVWAAAAGAFRHRTGRACPGCGRVAMAHRWAGPESAARWGRWAVGVAVVIPLLYAATRYAWALGIPLGISEETLRSGQESGLWAVGAGLATLAVAGAGLTLGLSQRWGEVAPRWLPLIGGKSVRPAAATVPALVAAALVTSAGLMFVRLALTGAADDFLDELQGAGWALLGPELLWPLWGVALAAAAVTYHLRRSRHCDACGAV